MKSLVEHMARALVNNPEEVRVTERETAEGVDIVLSVAPGDMGKVIGKQGRIAKAMRTVLKAAAPDGKKYNLEIE